MSIKTPNDQPSEASQKLTPQMREFAEDNFFNGQKLAVDAGNAWETINFLATPKSIQEIQPLFHYEETIAQTMAKYPEGYVDYIIELSDPTAIAEFDKLVDEFNLDLPRIKETADIPALKDFIKRARAIIQSI